jgi:hypothetical protein
LERPIDDFLSKFRARIGYEALFWPIFSCIEIVQLTLLDADFCRSIPLLFLLGSLLFPLKTELSDDPKIKFKWHTICCSMINSTMKNIGEYLRYILPPLQQGRI